MSVGLEIFTAFKRWCDVKKKKKCGNHLCVAYVLGGGEHQ